MSDGENGQNAEPIIWMRPEHPGKGPAPRHSRAEIAEAAIEIADTGGIETLSMRKVAAKIGAGTMSLYRYVHNKDELHALMVDSILMSEDDEAEDPVKEWREELRDIAWGTRALVLAHPWFPALAAEIAAPGPNMLRGLETAMVALDPLGLSIDEMLEITTMVMTLSTGMVQEDQAQRAATLRSAPEEERRQFRNRDYIRSLVESGEHPYLRRIVVDAQIPHEDESSRFQRAIDRLLAGIAATVEPRGPGEG